MVGGRCSRMAQQNIIQQKKTTKGLPCRTPYIHPSFLLLTSFKMAKMLKKNRVKRSVHAKDKKGCPWGCSLVLLTRDDLAGKSNEKNVVVVEVLVFRIKGGLGKGVGVYDVGREKINRCDWWREKTENNAISGHFFSEYSMLCAQLFIRLSKTYSSKKNGGGGGGGKELLESEWERERNLVPHIELE